MSEVLQNTLGRIVILVTRAKPRYLYEHKVYVSSHFTFGVSLGKYIIFGDKQMLITKNDVLHEYGHQLQSHQLGWEYLFTVGIVSITRNIYDRVFHKKWSDGDRYKWYYSSFPEKQADELGGVNRRFYSY